MSGERIYETHCPGCYTKIRLAVSTEDKGEASISFTLTLNTYATQFKVSEAAGKERRQNADGDKALGN